MENMKCYECVLKHLSKALSYGKEVMSGHDRSNVLDHRIDLLGEIGNAEDHLKLIDDGLFEKVKAFRADLQANQVLITMDTLQTIRDMYKEVETLAYGANNVTATLPSGIAISDTPDILFPSITNLAWFRSAFNSLSKMTNYNNVYYISSSVDLSGFDIAKYEAGKLKNDVIIWNEQTILLKSIDAREFPRILDNKTGYDYRKIATAIHPTGTMYYFGAFPLLITLDNMQSIHSDIASIVDWDTALTMYGNKYPVTRSYRAFEITVNTDKIICCSNKSKLKSGLLARWQNETAYQSIIHS